MRNRELHDALFTFARAATELLSAEREAGAELRFDVDAAPGPGPTLYRYRPLTGEFVAELWPRLAALPAFGPAAQALDRSSRVYLGRDESPSAEAIDAEPALRALLERLTEDRTDFALSEVRFAQVYADVERALYADAARARVVAPLYGLELGSDRVSLGHGLSLRRGTAADAPEAALWTPAPGRTDPPVVPNAVVELDRQVPVGAPAPLDEARRRFPALLADLRLFRSGRLSLGSVAWHRLDEGPWSPIGLEGSGRGRGEPWTLAASEEAELREFLDRLERGSLAGRVAWARTRFEFGCGRHHDDEALSDYLLALRALLDDADEFSRATLSLRVAALCAEERDRPGVRERVDAALAWERRLMGAPPLAEPDHEGGPTRLVLEVEEHLRALLRDVSCGFLAPELRRTADEILLESGEGLAEPRTSQKAHRQTAFDVRPRDNRRERGEPSHGPAPRALRRERRLRHLAAEAAAPPLRPLESDGNGYLSAVAGYAEGVRVPADASRRGAADADEDAAGYSAPV